jgi:hypothetical protein
MAVQVVVAETLVHLRLAELARQGKVTTVVKELIPTGLRAVAAVVLVPQVEMELLLEQILVVLAEQVQHHLFQVLQLLMLAAAVAVLAIQDIQEMLAALVALVVVVMDQEQMAVLQPLVRQTLAAAVAVAVTVQMVQLRRQAVQVL